ncbi:MAG: 4Fe-4S dicluster domain-containing protein [Planctomycetota bacterium]|jgi:Fe-S-cluster-containing dehydrogenase component
MIDQQDATGRRVFLTAILCNAAGLYVGSLTAFGRGPDITKATTVEELSKFDWGFIVDTTRCIGCGSCVRACKIENDVPDGYFRTWVERYEIDEDEQVHVDSPNGALEGFRTDNERTKPVVKAFFVPKLCNHCEASACTQVCPVGATYHSADGVVLIDKEHCIGCGYCVQACPYGCRYISHDIGTADKCTLCYHRLRRGLDPACVMACPRDARICGNLKDPESRIRKFLHERRYNILKPELSTKPKCYYVGLDVEVK